MKLIPASLAKAFAGCAAAITIGLLSTAAASQPAQVKPPNILVIWGDDVGMWNIDQDKWFNGVQNNLVTPVITNLKLDPFERFQHARGFDEWQENRSYLITPAVNQLAAFAKTFKDFPPRQKSFDADIDKVVESMMAGSGK